MFEITSCNHVAEIVTAETIVFDAFHKGGIRPEWSTVRRRNPLDTIHFNTGRTSDMTPLALPASMCEAFIMHGIE
jgi:hypothetical protein